MENLMNIEIVEPAAFLITPVEQLYTYPKLIETCARVCYKSEHLSKEETRDAFLTKLLTEYHHESCFEHAVISYRFIFSRCSSHQEVRHRIQAISQESMRWCDYSNSTRFGSLNAIVPPSIKEVGKEALDILLDVYSYCYNGYNKLRELGIPAEDARYALPHGTKTELVATMNLRMWRHFIRERGLNLHAQWEIRKLALNVLYELYHYIPVFFRDLVDVLVERKEKGKNESNS
jgi:thymidylate synthase (FAD)